jgi:hypothetical protein
MVTYGPRELAHDLRRLLDLPAQTKAEQARWYKEAQGVQDRIKASTDLGGMPHSLWHFFADADVRAKVPAIRDAQVEQVRKHIAVLETGAMPPDDSRPGTLGDFFRFLWRALRHRG